MEKIINKIKQADYLLVIMFLIPFLYGTLYDVSALFVAFVIQGITILIFIKNKKLNMDLNDSTICFGIIFLFSLLSVIWSVDKNDAMIGCLKYLSIFNFIILIMQFEKEKKEKLLKTVPFSALAMLILSLAMAIFPFSRNIVMTNSGRLKGLFEYANTFSLFMLIGVIISTNIKKSKLNILISAILLLGILFTGSRTTLFLAMAYLIYLLIRKRKNKKDLFIILGVVILVILSIFLFKSLSIFDNVFKISVNPGTLIERLIFWQDGIKLLKSNVFGYGNMGYFYKIYEIQTAGYETKFVHNEYLQMALDIGIIPTIVFIFFVIKSLFSKENSKLFKLVLLAIVLHINMDIDLEYLIIWYILSLTMNSKTIKKMTLEFNVTFLTINIILLFVYCYYFLATFFNFIGKNEIAQKMINNYTEAKVETMLKTDNIDYAHKMADEIIENNSYIDQAYKVNSIYYLQNSKFDKMAEIKKKQISIDKYNIETYEEYVLLLSKVLDYYSEKQDTVKLEKYIDKVLEVKDLIKSVNENTNKLEYRIYDDVELKLSPETEEYINNMEQMKLLLSEQNK